MYGWQDSYSVGVTEFDHAHQKLFGYFNEFYAALQQGKSQEHVADILEKTYTYTRQHFESEERWMKAKNYPALAAHKQQHIQFQAQIEKYLTDFKAGRLVLSGSISKLLREWLGGHIMSIDQQYARHFGVQNKPS